jgi:hypothetical protein
MNRWRYVKCSIEINYTHMYVFHVTHSYGHCANNCEHGDAAKLSDCRIDVCSLNDFVKTIFNFVFALGHFRLFGAVFHKARSSVKDLLGVLSFKYSIAYTEASKICKWIVIQFICPFSCIIFWSRLAYSDYSFSRITLLHCVHWLIKTQDLS